MGLKNRANRLSGLGLSEVLKKFPNTLQQKPASCTPETSSMEDGMSMGVSISRLAEGAEEQTGNGVQK